MNHKVLSSEPGNDVIDAIVLLESAALAAL